MTENRDFSLELIGISRTQDECGPLVSISEERMPEKLAKAASQIKDILIEEHPLTLMEVLILSKLFDPKFVTGERKRDRVATTYLLLNMFSEKVRTRDQLALLRRMLKSDLLRMSCDRFVMKDRSKLLIEKEFRLLNILSGEMELSPYTVANIIGDEDSKYCAPREGFPDNLAFIESWRHIVELIRNEMEFDNFHRNYGYGLDSLYRAQWRLEYLHRQLALTTADIPFRKLYYDLDLSFHEQLIIMYDVYEYGNNRYACELKNSALLMPPDSPCFAVREVLNNYSRLVREQVYEKATVEREGRPIQIFRLKRFMYCAILGDAILKVQNPLV